MKKFLSSLFLTIVSCAVFASCGRTPSEFNNSDAGPSSPEVSPQIVDYTSVDPAENDVVLPADAEESKSDDFGSFSVVTENTDGYMLNDNELIIKKGGTYELSGDLAGNAVIEAGEDEVTLVLAGVKISSDRCAPIYAKECGKLTVNIKENTYNEITDGRAAYVENTENTGSEEAVTAENAKAAVYSAADLKIKGAGSLVVKGSFNNGIHSKDDLKISDAALKVTASNNALKGNDSVTVDSGDIILISQNGDGIKTENTSVSNKGSQKGSITLSGGHISIDSCDDAVNAAYDAEITGDVNLVILTGKYSSCAKNALVAASKGIKAENAVRITAGTVSITSSDDAIHANSGTELENGETSVGEVKIDGGSITIETGDDGIHADGSITINGGFVNIVTSYEGIEAPVITQNGGSVYVYATDDGINASDGSGSGFGGGGIGGGGRNPGGMRMSYETTSYGGFGGGGFDRGGQGNRGGFDPGNRGGFDHGEQGGPGGNVPGGQSGCTLTVNGGYLEVTTPSGDTDAIDCNGSYYQTGGFVFVKGGSSTGNMSGSIDVDGKIVITGGTTVALGGICETPTESQYFHVMNRVSFAKGEYVVYSGSEDIISFKLDKTYSSGWICSDAFESGKSYTLKCGEKTVAEWKN